MGNADHDSFLSDNQFPYILIIGAVVVHLTIMTIVIYYSCCRHKCCECRINIQNNTIHQNNLNECSRRNVAIAHEDSVDSEGLVDANQRPVTSWDTSIITRVRTRLQGAPETRPSGSLDRSLPPPYSEGESSSGHTNSAANFDDIDLYLPPYEEIVNQLPTWKENEEMAKLPTYEEATEDDRRDKQ